MKWKDVLVWGVGLGLVAHTAYMARVYAPLLAQVRFPLVEQILSGEMLQFFDYSNLPLVRQTTPEELTDKLNESRLEAGMEVFSRDENVCSLAGQLAVSGAVELSQELVSECPGCNHTALLRITNLASPSMLTSQMSAQGVIDQVVLSENYSDLCLVQEGNYLTLLFAGFHPPTPQRATAPVIARSMNIEPTEFSESELMAALREYRRAHRRSELKLDENLCRYARQRVNEHTEQFASRSKESYPVPAKYPLDAHEGFRRDGDSGSLFDITKMRLVGENLAYWPTAEHPHHVIEWGWDSSTEGHREAQLSEEFTHACISGGQGFFVAIFGKK